MTVTPKNTRGSINRRLRMKVNKREASVRRPIGGRGRAGKGARSDRRYVRRSEALVSAVRGGVGGRVATPTPSSDASDQFLEMSFHRNSWLRIGLKYTPSTFERVRRYSVCTG